MSTVAEEVVEPENPEVHAEFPEHSHRHYYLVALVLALITGLEVGLTYADFLGKAFLPLLLFLMMVKFVMVVLEFMHLRHDAKVFHYLFWSGFFLAAFVYIAYLATFKFFIQP